MAGLIHHQAYPLVHLSGTVHHLCRQALLPLGAICNNSRLLLYHCMPTAMTVGYYPGMSSATAADYAILHWMSSAAAAAYYSHHWISFATTAETTINTTSDQEHHSKQICEQENVLLCYTIHFRVRYSPTKLTCFSLQTFRVP